MVTRPLAINFRPITRKLQGEKNTGIAGDLQMENP